MFNYFFGPKTVDAVITVLLSLVDKLDVLVEKKEAERANLERNIIALGMAEATAYAEQQRAIRIRSKVAALVS